ncbi:acetate kinase [Prauserella marina]|uniref:Acetate kinase n=1 Tax=Prauserella marina TaxID=530584 RepID=A0A222VJD8_9PSEU|nr:acetate/propionate family kinase [Prauserella marina]ASR34038.1 acetate kinase [Prauserella marina]PWV82668.1 acetate kinase [Prauserella marina]SDC74259.1 acetate kinase [Prauserella marina]
MYVLVVNAGSSSLKVRLLGPSDEVVGKLDLDSWQGAHETEELANFVAGLERVDAVGHRIVHGGTEFTAPAVIDERVRQAIAGLTELAPLHQPRGLAGIDAVADVLPGKPAVACFDTAFHASLPDAAATYALPKTWNERWSLRRYGFHGLSHDYASRRAAELLGRQVTDLRLVTCHLGAGASLAAVGEGRSLDTTMGFTPLAGLVMATRTGSVDPGLVLWLQEHAGLGADEVGEVLEHESGLAGLSGGSGDMREVIEAADAGNPAATLAFDVYIHRLRREIAAMTAALDGIDALVFTGGVGEHSPRVRAAALAGLGYLGAVIDEGRNEQATADADITAAGATVSTLVITAREDLEIAQHTRKALTG